MFREFLGVYRNRRNRLSSPYCLMQLVPRTSRPGHRLADGITAPAITAPGYTTCTKRADASSRTLHSGSLSTPKHAAYRTLAARTDLEPRSIGRAAPSAAADHR